MVKKLNDVVITAALRTPIGTYKGSLKYLSAVRLGGLVIKEAVCKSKLKADDIDEVIMGHVLTSGSGQNPARQASIYAGIPASKPAHIINQVCGSGLRSVVSGYQSIKLREKKIIVAGGQENMSRATHTIFYRENKNLDEKNLIDTIVNDGLVDPFNNYHMGVTAENVAGKYQISRNEQDKFALNSQLKALRAQSEKKFHDEIINCKISSKKSEIDFSKDEHPREGISLETLKKLKPVFQKNGTVTAGNASGINDGAAAVTLMSNEECEKRDIKKLVTIKSWASCGVDPSLMGTGPIPSSKKALDLAGWSIKDIDLFEINEAFAAQSIAVIKTLSIPEEKVNVNGGAIALGHPIGASGTRILVTLIHEMIKRDAHKGLATLCIGGGMGIAMCLER